LSWASFLLFSLSFCKQEEIQAEGRQSPGSCVQKVPSLYSTINLFILIHTWITGIYFSMSSCNIILFIKGETYENPSQPLLTNDIVRWALAKDIVGRWWG
jgi:hypothetical protein